MTTKKQTSTLDAESMPHDSAAFQIPSKERKVIPIVMPKAPPHREVVSSPKIQNASSSHSKRPSNGTAAESIASSREVDVTVSESIDATRRHQHRQDDLGDPSAARCILPNQPGTTPLDVFSSNYVPRWLRAVNESNANLQPCPAFPTIDFASYLETIVGPGFVQTVSKVSLPPPVKIRTVEQPLSPQNYVSFWLTLLQNEFAAQNLQYMSYRLYDQRLQSVTGRDGLFSLHIPGLRENAPRVDLGDVIHIRPLLPNQLDIESQVHHWINYGQHHGYFCPGFTGQLYDPQVWEINRAKEQVTIKMEGFDGVLACNVVFLLQESKLEPVCRAVQSTAISSTWLRMMLFPEISDGVMQTTLSQANFGIHWIDNLNWEQKKAVHSICNANYGTMPYLISGPPGTGKTKTLVETALQLLREPGHVLICAPSDAAADTLALRLSMHLDHTLLFRLNGWSRTFAEVPDRLLLYTFANDLSFSLPPVEKLLSYRVVVTTCRDADLLNRARLTNSSLSKLMNGVYRLLAPGSLPLPLHWTALLLDEAAQATEPDVLIPLTVVAPPDGNQLPLFVAAGDQYQLGPKLAEKSYLGISLFQRLFDRKVYAEHPLSRKNGIQSLTVELLPMMRPSFTNLIRNYRSHPAILSVSSSLFYNDSLIPERKTSKEVLSWPGWPSQDGWPVLFQQNDSEDLYESITAGDGTGAGALYNPGEAAVAVRLAQSLLQSITEEPHSLRQNQIMIMSPYRAQVTQLRKEFRQNKLYEVNIGPLEAFQGLEARIVIICTTRTRMGTSFQKRGHHVLVDKCRGLGVIDEPQRFNVAITRAQEGLIVIGNAHCLTSTSDESWLEFIAFCKRNDCYDAPYHFPWPDLGDSHRQGRLERALVYAALGKEDAERNHSSITQQQGSVPKVRPRFQLKAPQQDMDEQMWQFKELAQLHDSENVDLLLDSHTSREKRVDEAGKEVENETHNADDGYDRNLTQEFHSECAPQ